MKKNRSLSTVSLMVVALGVTLFSGAEGQVVNKESLVRRYEDRIIRIWNFEGVGSGELPAGWKIEGTNQRGPLATWQVIEDTTAPSGEKVLALTSINHDAGGSFNLCWTDATSFLDGEIAVHFKSVRGRVDQGGGVIWRAQDKDNYYIARFNPLEDNFRIYYVKDANRKMLASVRVKLPAGQWHTLSIVQEGNRIEGYLNRKKMLETRSGAFNKPGGVGLWTKADAVTQFDDLTVVSH